MTRLSSQSKSFLADFMRGCRNMTTAMCAPFEPQGLGHRAAAAPGASSVFGGLTLQSSADAVLLFRRMEILGLDSEEVARCEPLKFRQMLSRCDDCEHKRRCVQDIASRAELSAWHFYCPNYDALHALRAQSA
jgi:hypothetical protein